VSKKTRIKRPTTSTPRKAPQGRMIHQSTHLHTISTPAGPRTIKAPGTTHRAEKPQSKAELTGMALNNRMDRIPQS
jgi:hypothetical protein